MIDEKNPAGWVRRLAGCSEKPQEVVRRASTLQEKLSVTSEDGSEQNPMIVSGSFVQEHSQNESWGTKVKMPTEKSSGNHWGETGEEELEALDLEGPQKT